MSGRVRLSLALGAVLLAGVALKLAIGRHSAAETSIVALPRVIALLEQQGLAVTGSTSDLNLTLIEATKPPGCRMTVALMAPQGWHGGIVTSLGRPDAVPFFVFDGRISDHQPTLAASTRHYATLLLREFGFPAAVHPLVGVIADPACGARAFPWGEVAAVLPEDQPGTAARK